MPANRFELMTFALQKRCSTAELSRQLREILTTYLKNLYLFDEMVEEIYLPVLS